jgi:hypothetical protein
MSCGDRGPHSSCLGGCLLRFLFRYRRGLCLGFRFGSS